jgi:DNA-binding FadR family transcriptional regulator
MVRTRNIQPEATTELMGGFTRRSMGDLIAEKLAILVSSGVLAVGDEIPAERELAASLSVSRETVRSAIGILARHGILRVSQGARTVVASKDVSKVTSDGPVVRVSGRYSLVDVHESRLLVESHIARLAAVCVTDELLARLENSIIAQRACGENAVRFLLSDREFHALLYKAGGNEPLFDIAMALYNYMLDHRRRIVSRPGSIAQSIKDHCGILEALREHDQEAAAVAVSVHATRIYETTRKFLEETKRISS